MMTVYYDVLARIRAEYLEMPGMNLTTTQVQRLCGVEAPACLKALSTLVHDKFLCLKPNGTYARVAEGITPRPQPRQAKAELRSSIRALAKR
jgi:hypothetical protein